MTCGDETPTIAQSHIHDESKSCSSDLAHAGVCNHVNPAVTRCVTVQNAALAIQSLPSCARRKVHTAFNLTRICLILLFCALCCTFIRLTNVNSNPG